MGHIKRKLKKALYPAFNMISGVLLQLSNPFKKGDFIEINGQVGSVEHKGLRRTTLKNMDGEEVKIANTLFYTKDLYNLTHKNIVNLDLQVDVCYSEDMKVVKSLISDFIKNSTTVLQTPSAKVFVRKIKNTQVELGIKAWCSIEKYLEATSETEELLKDYLTSKGIALSDEKLDQLMTA